jgi:phage-related protein
VELRAGAGRVFYFACSGHKLVLLHGYVKKSRRAPKREIEMALRRMAEVLEVQ